MDGPETRAARARPPLRGHFNSFTAPKAACSTLHSSLLPDHRPLTTDHRPPTTHHRPPTPPPPPSPPPPPPPPLPLPPTTDPDHCSPTTDHRPPTTDHRPPSSLFPFSRPHPLDSGGCGPAYIGACVVVGHLLQPRERPRIADFPEGRDGRVADLLVFIAERHYHRILDTGTRQQRQRNYRPVSYAIRAGPERTDDRID